MTPYAKATYMFIAHGADLYVINRDNIGLANMQSFVTLYKHFDADIVALDAEAIESYRTGVGLANGKFYVLDTKMDQGMPEESKRVIYESKENVGRVVDIRYKIKSGYNWQRP